MKRPPTDFEILREIYDRYYPVFCSYSRETPSRAAKIMVPIDVVAIAKKFDVDPDVIFGRLYFHLEPKYGFEKKDGTKVSFFTLKIGEDKHCIQFPLLTSVLAGLWEERRRHMTSRYLAVAALVISCVSLVHTYLKSRPIQPPEPTFRAVTPAAQPLRQP